MVVFILTSLLTASMDDQQTIAEPVAASRSVTAEKAETKVSEATAGWAEEFTPITFVSYR
ncbi:hypothetical protein HHL16_04075 [Pseudoflavitalea sp. G-6-1-2]|uniref:hypothetical protein n=1 Tax=Pseudoflavitalea sp. G-6-1-2 TaxID=2728841 RepID=UPI00146AEBE8|nr:hypothetical protein [Pseudoflavitalea sp. G-6-1-2]NML20035.1 hypothetical protein [Pseudoflavitalea sp. G-6-1-2]